MTKLVYDIIKKQNGEAFAKAIRNYDNGIFDVPDLPLIVRYAGRNALPLLPFLESLKEIHSLYFLLLCFKRTLWRESLFFPDRRQLPQALPQDVRPT